MLHVALYQPEIPGNTGSVIRLCANTGARLHLVEPLGFSMEDRLLRRAGLDYHEYARLTRHRDYAALRAALPQARVLAFSTHGSQCYSGWRYRPGDLLLFGPETRGLPPALRQQADACLRLPMQPHSRSLNLANAVAVAVFEAWRQTGFAENWSAPAT